jgi:hypothetical protein
MSHLRSWGSSPLWCVGVALLAVGTLLVSERAAFADTGDPAACDASCAASYPNDPDAYDSCMQTCIGDYSIDFCGWRCTQPLGTCPNLFGQCEFTPCTGTLCPRTCKCYASGLGTCKCSKSQ